MSQEEQSKAASPVTSVARAFLVEGELADALLLLDRNVNRGEQMEPDALALCERAAVDVKDPQAVHALLTALGNRLAEMTGGRAEAFEDALAGFPEEERFGIPALATVLWPTLENLHRAGTTRPEEYQRAIARHRPALRALYQRSSGRSEEAFELTWNALHDRLPVLFAQHAAFLDRSGTSSLRKLLQTPEGVAVAAGALGLITLRMPVSTPLVCGALALVGYGALAPLAERLRESVYRLVMDALTEEDVVIRSGVAFEDLTLSSVLRTLKPTLFTALLAGQTDPAALRQHLQPLLAAFRRQCTAQGGPGLAYAEAVEEVVFGKYAPRLRQVADRARAQVEAGLAGRVMSDPHGAGLLVATATLPLSFVAARATPLGLWDLPLMVGLFYGAGRVASSVLASPRRQMAELDAAMNAEQRLLSGLYSAGGALLKDP